VHARGAELGPAALTGGSGGGGDQPRRRAGPPHGGGGGARAPAGRAGGRGGGRARFCLRRGGEDVRGAEAGGPSSIPRRSGRGWPGARPG